MRDINYDNITDTVVDAYAGTSDERLREILSVLIPRLHRKATRREVDGIPEAPGGRVSHHVHHRRSRQRGRLGSSSGSTPCSCSGGASTPQLRILKLPKRVRRCDGNNERLAKIGRALGTELVISGNVASLGDAFVLNVKAIESASAKESRKAVSDPLRGSPDELIEACAPEPA